MTVIDLAAVRDRIALEKRIGHEIAAGLAAFLVRESVRQAERAFAAAAPLVEADEGLSRIIHRGCLRQLRADVRRQFAATTDDLRRWAHEKALEIYRGRVIVLEDERVAHLKRGEG